MTIAPVRYGFRNMDLVYSIWPNHTQIRWFQGITDTYFIDAQYFLRTMAVWECKLDLQRMAQSHSDRTLLGITTLISPMRWWCYSRRQFRIGASFVGIGQSSNHALRAHRLARWQGTCLSTAYKCVFPRVTICCRHVEHTYFMLRVIIWQNFVLLPDLMYSCISFGAFKIRTVKLALLQSYPRRGRTSKIVSYGQLHSNFGRLGRTW